MIVNFYVLAFACLGNEVLLVRRSSDQTFGAGLYSMVGGKVEQGETARQAIKREVREETGLDIPETAFELMHTLHRKGTETEFIALCFKVDLTGMPAPHNTEPDQHDDMRFFPLNQLPENIVPAHKQAIECIRKNVHYSEHGW